MLQFSISPHFGFLPHKTAQSVDWNDRLLFTTAQTALLQTCCRTTLSRASLLPASSFSSWSRCFWNLCARLMIETARCWTSTTRQTCAACWTWTSQTDQSPCSNLSTTAASHSSIKSRQVRGARWRRHRPCRTLSSSFRYEILQNVHCKTQLDSITV